MPLPELTLADLVEASQKITTSKLNMQGGQNEAQTKATEFISTVTSCIDVVQHDYSLIDPKIKKDDSNFFLQQVLAGALLFQLMNITMKQPISSSIKSECHIEKQILELFAVRNFSDIQPKDLVEKLRRLAKFIDDINASPNAPTWIKTIENEILHKAILSNMRSYPVWWGIMTNVVNPVRTQIEAQKPQSTLGYYIGQRIWTYWDPQIEASIDFIQNVASYATTSEATSVPLTQSTASMHPMLLLEKIIKGAMLLELMTLATTSTKTEDPARIRLEKVIFDFFEVSQLAQISEEAIVDHLKVLDQLILATPETIRFSKVKSNDVLHQNISAELKKRADWVVVTAENEASTVAQPS